MKVIRTEHDRFIFGLNQEERTLFLEILKMFPLVPPAHHPLSKKGRTNVEDQRLLDEAIAEQRAENTRRIQNFLREPSRFVARDKGFQLSLDRVEIEWLLQALNDVRVGAWLALGKPEDIHSTKVERKNARYAFALDASGYFQCALLAALGYPL